MNDIVEPRVALLAITKHGANQVAELTAQLPLADVIVSEKLTELLAHVPNKVNTYSGALSAQIASLFTQYDQIIFFISLGAVVRLIAPHMKSKDEEDRKSVV